MHRFKPSAGRRLEGRFLQLVAKHGKIRFRRGETGPALRNLDLGAKILRQIDLCQRHARVLVIRLQLGLFHRRAEILRCQLLGNLKPLACHLKIGDRGGTLFGIGSRGLGNGTVIGACRGLDFRLRRFDPGRQGVGIQLDQNIALLHRAAFNGRHLAGGAADFCRYGDHCLWLGHAAGAHSAAYRTVLDRHGGNDRAFRNASRCRRPGIGGGRPGGAGVCGAGVCGTGVCCRPVG